MRGRATAGGAGRPSWEPAFLNRADPAALLEKGHVSHEEQGCASTAGGAKASRAEVGAWHLVDTFFDGSAEQVVAAVLGGETSGSEEELERLLHSSRKPRRKDPDERHEPAAEHHDQNLPVWRSRGVTALLRQRSAALGDSPGDGRRLRSGDAAPRNDGAVVACVQLSAVAAIRARFSRRDRNRPALNGLTQRHRSGRAVDAIQLNCRNLQGASFHLAGRRCHEPGDSARRPRSIDVGSLPAPVASRMGVGANWLRRLRRAGASQAIRALAAISVAARDMGSAGRVILPSAPSNGPTIAGRSSHELAHIRRGDWIVR